MNPSAQAIKVALTIAGSDGSGGAGIQADLKTFQALGVYGVSAITAVTVQNTQQVYAVQEIDPQIVYDQVACLFEDMAIHAVKIGMVASAGLIQAVARVLSAEEVTDEQDAQILEENESYDEDKYVLVEFDVTRYGAVRDLKILESNPTSNVRFRRMARNTINSTPFRPRLDNGQPITTENVKMIYRFQ